MTNEIALKTMIGGSGGDGKKMRLYMVRFDMNATNVYEPQTSWYRVVDGKSEAIIPAKSITRRVQDNTITEGYSLTETWIDDEGYRNTKTLYNFLHYHLDVRNINTPKEYVKSITNEESGITVFIEDGEEK